MQFQRPALVQQQKLKLSPQMYQSIQLMALPLQDLQAKIHEELEANPALEIMEEKSQLSLDENQPAPEENDYFEDSSDPGFLKPSTASDSEDSKRQFLEGALARPESLQEHLLWQLHLQPISDPEIKIGEKLIQNLDENGFHLERLEDLLTKEELVKADRIKEMIQGFDPQGTCVDSFEESLLVQSRLREDTPKYTEEIITDHLKDLDRGKYKQIAKALKTNEYSIEQVFHFLRTLTPFPGRIYSSSTLRYVVPELSVEQKDGVFVLIFNDEEIPVLGVNPFFKEMYDNKSRGKKDAKQKEADRFVKERVKDAQFFIRSIHQRNNTLKKVSQAIIEFQRDFFLKGPKHLAPLTLKNIAEDVGVHEATVSRITNGKYMQTEYGIFELKHFFSNAITGTGSTGSHYSKEGVKEVIREIISDYTGSKKLSDQKISDMLAQKGINIARRTVAKYRKELDINSSYDR